MRFDYGFFREGLCRELKITKRAADALSVEAGDALFWDRGLAGFGVRVHATGGKVYVAQSRGPGGPKRVTLDGEMSADSSSTASSGARIGGTHDSRPRRARACASTLQDGRRRGVDNHILPALGGVAASSVGRGEVSPAPPAPARRRKHLHRHLAEFAGRHNIRPMDTLDQIISMSDGMNGNGSATRT